MRQLSLWSILFLVLVFSAPVALAADPPRVLVYTTNGKGYVHDNRAASVAAIKKMGEENNFAVDSADNPSVLTDENLKRYKVIVFSNTNNETCGTEEQKAAFQRFIHAGGGFVGIHSASGSERQWPWYWALLGGKFVRHAAFQPFTLKVMDPQHPSTSFLGESWNWLDEFYYVDHMNPELHILLAGDMTTLKDPAKDKQPGALPGHLFPLAWCHEFEGCRAWYTALGHTKGAYSDPKFYKHLLGGILWAMGVPTPSAAPPSSTAPQSPTQETK